MTFCCVLCSDRLIHKLVRYNFESGEETATLHVFYVLYWFCLLVDSNSQYQPAAALVCLHSSGAAHPCQSVSGLKSKVRAGHPGAAQWQNLPCHIPSNVSCIQAQWVWRVNPPCVHPEHSCELTWLVVDDGESTAGSLLHHHHCWLFVVQNNHHRNTDTT